MGKIIKLPFCTSDSKTKGNPLPSKIILIPTGLSYGRSVGIGVGAKCSYSVGFLSGGELGKGHLKELSTNTTEL